MAFDLEKHLKQEHKMSPISVYLREIVYGGNDGIVTTFAVVAGFTGAQQALNSLPLLSVLLFGFANLFADGVSMALGNFLSTQSEQDVYANEKAKERREIRNNAEAEKAETISILQKKGFSQKQAEDLVKIYATNEDYWLNFMMDQELNLPNPESEHALKMALATFGAFVCFGLIPLLPYVFWHNRPEVFLYSAMASFLAMLALGILRWKVSRQHWLRSIAETLVLGGAASAVAYLVGSLFRI